ncbi:glycosyltransferase family 4 protein [Carnobacterium pleistocenium]|uniref:glycosyltransferase family 4 protein n=1 Tax=Carnobacterium pleistocenium TaxID=181073 RepID=UPI00055292BB|nr:glycosyltransferase family 4 protein [Carnobacterium pleistocenium]
MKKVAVVGYHGDGQVTTDGQGVKTSIITSELINVYGEGQVKIVNTYNWRKNAVKLAINCIIAIVTCENVVFLTDENGVKVFPKFFISLNKIFNKKLHYYVVGGWLTEYLQSDKKVKKYIKKLDGVYVELKSMHTGLKNQGLNNVVYINKFRRIKPVSIDSLKKFDKPPYRLCTFSRVLKEKGIEDAIEAVNNINREYSENIFELDIYGTIDESYRERFTDILDSQPDYIKYCGIVDFEKSTETLKAYFALLFPTYYKSEGYPNTFVDAFSAGLPIIASNYKYNSEIICSGKDGIIYDSEDPNALTHELKKIYNKPEIIYDMKINCLNRCSEFLPEKAIKILAENLDK